MSRVETPLRSVDARLDIRDRTSPLPTLKESEVPSMTTFQQQLVKQGVRLLIGEQNQALYDHLDWEQACAQFAVDTPHYPNYYARNFHGITGGYLTPEAAVTYDAVTAWASPPHEHWLRRQLLRHISTPPNRILDLGCGTGSSTVLLKQAFPDAEVTGLDLSPHMLVMAHHKAQQQQLYIHWQHGLAEATGFDGDQFDLVTASMLFHELPPPIARAVLQEAWRLCRSGGQVLILDGNQQRLRRTHWLIRLFREPYSQVYAAESVEEWMRSQGYQTSPTCAIGWIHQINSGQKASVRA